MPIRLPRLRPILKLGACSWLLSLSLPMAAAAAEPSRYELDPVHTRVLVAVEHAGFSSALGTVSGTTGTLLFDPEDWRIARLEASVPLARLDLGDTAWNRAALANNLLDTDDHPVATFVSTRVEPTTANSAKVCGDLTLHGITRELCLDVTMNALKRHPLPPFRRTAGFSATTSLSRKAFGIDAWPSVIGDSIELRIEAEAIRSGRAILEELDDKAPPAEALHVPSDTPGSEPVAVPQPEPEPEPELDPDPEPGNQP